MTNDERPCLIILAGPNGAGKSTAAPRLLRDLVQMDNFLNADTVARGLSDWAPEFHALAAGKLVIREARDFLKNRASFGIETTLAAQAHARLLEQAHAAGYRTKLLFLWLANPSLSVSRVAGRVAEGGHDIPTSVILRRYECGLRNLFRLYMPLLDDWRLLDTGDPAHPFRVIAESIDGQLSVNDLGIWRKLEQEYGKDDG
jgi:predicted ABC-type ATPase